MTLTPHAVEVAVTLSFAKGATVPELVRSIRAASPEMLPEGDADAIEAVNAARKMTDCVPLMDDTGFVSRDRWTVWTRP